MSKKKDVLTFGKPKPIKTTSWDADINCYCLGIQDRKYLNTTQIIDLQNYLEKCVLRDREYQIRKVIDTINNHLRSCEECMPRLRKSNLQKNKEELLIFLGQENILKRLKKEIGGDKQ